MRPTLLALMLITATQAAEPKIEFDKQPKPSIRGVPKEAKLQSKSDTLNHGTLAKQMADSVQTITVQHASKEWSDKELTQYLTGLLTDTSTATYTFQIWSQLVLEPEVECAIRFKDQKQGKLLLWDTCGCYQDPQGRWWFLSLFDYYHANHPHGTRRIQKEP